MDFKFTEGPVEVRDIFTGSKSHNKILVTRDDEEFLVYQWDEKDIQKGRIQHVHKFNESSNYVFEWPFLAYVKDQKNIIIHNVHSPKKCFFIDMGI